MPRIAALGLALLLTAATPAVGQTRDADGDGMPNAWERSHDLDPHDASDASRDPDRDHLVNVFEYQRDGDPHDADTDDDGLRDGAEVRRWESLVDVADQLVGRVSVSGRCPTGDSDDPCALRHLFAVDVIVRDSAGSVVAERRTLTSGRFALSHLRPGRYDVEAEAIAGTIAPAPIDARVPRNQAGPTRMTFTLSDSNRRGVVGQATESPTCPVQRVGEECIAPLQDATIEIHDGDAGGPIVAQTTTGQDGYYAFQLDPGTYTLIARKIDDRDLPAPPGPQTFTVFPNDTGPNAVDALYDTGIR